MGGDSLIGKARTSLAGRYANARPGVVFSTQAMILQARQGGADTGPPLIVLALAAQATGEGPGKPESMGSEARCSGFGRNYVPRSRGTIGVADKDQTC